jgi:hypothetical protein
MTAVSDQDFDIRDGPTPRPGGPRVVRPRDVWERISLPLVRSLVLALVLGLAAAGGTVGVMSTRPATYQSQATLLMDEPLAIAASADAGVVLKLAALRPKYAALATTAPVLQAAARRADLPEAAVAAGARVVLAADNLTLESVGASSDAATARTLAQSLAEALSAYVAAEQLSLAVPAYDRLAVKVIDAAGPARKTSPTLHSIVTAAVVTGVVVLLLGYVVAQLAWTRPRRL